MVRRKYRITIRVGGMEFLWTRFATDAVQLVVEAQAVCRAEWPGRDDVKIVGWETV